MRAIVLPLVALSLLTACGESETGETVAVNGEPVAVNDVVSEAKKLGRALPGQYRSTTKLVDFDVPGMPAGVADKVRDSMSNIQNQTREFCLTKAQAEEGWEDMTKKMNNSAEGADCVFDKFSADDGNLDAQMTCKAEAGVNAQITMKGKMKPDKQVMTMVVSQTGGPSKMDMTMEVINERIGDCP